MIHYRYPICLEIAGPTAIWTRPDSGDSPISYPAPTPSAVRGIFESILWGEAVRIVPRKVEICAPVIYHSYVTNYGGPLRSADQRRKGSNYRLYATVLIDVCYRLYADVLTNPKKADLPEKAASWDKRTTSPGHAYQEIFNRRLKRGQSFGSIALGWKEFTPTYVGPFREATHVMEELPDIPIPSMLNETFADGYRSEFHPSYFQNLVIHKGILVFPGEKDESE